MIDLTLKHDIIKNIDLSIVIPIYNEEANILNLLQTWEKELKSYKINYLFVLVNDGSTDLSLKIIQDFNSNKVIINKINSGHGRSIRQGYDFALTFTDCSFILQIDSDGQCDPQFFKLFWNQKDNYDALIGKRVLRHDGKSRVLISKILSLLSFLVTRVKIIDPNTPYRVFNRKTLEFCLSKINCSLDIHNVAITFILKKYKFSIGRVPITFLNRSGGVNSINVFKIIQMGINLLFDLHQLNKKTNDIKKII